MKIKNEFSTFRQTILLFALMLVSCNGAESAGPPGTACCSTTGPQLIVKYKKDQYAQFVCLHLSEDRERYISAQDPAMAQLQAPVPLIKGYYQLRFRCNAITDVPLHVFANYSQEEADALITRVIDPDPLLEEYDCCELCLSGKADALIQIIQENRLNECQANK